MEPLLRCTKWIASESDRVSIPSARHAKSSLGCGSRSSSLPGLPWSKVSKHATKHLPVERLHLAARTQARPFNRVLLGQVDVKTAMKYQHPELDIVRTALNETAPGAPQTGA